MSDLVTVVIPTHNSSRFIGKTIASVLGQTRPPHELIIVDDASTDETRDVVRAIAAASSSCHIQLHPLESNSGGPSVPLNVGVSLAKTPLIATLDHDDQMLPSKLELQAECLTLVSDLGIVLSGFYYQRSGQRKEVSLLEILTEMNVARFPLRKDGFYQINSRDLYMALVERPLAGSCSNFLFPKRVWQACGGFDAQVSTCSDYRFLQKVAHTYNVGVVDKTLFYYHWSDESLYRLSTDVTLRRERLHVFRQFDRRLLDPKRRRQLTLRKRNELVRLADRLKEQKEYGKSAVVYAESLIKYGPNRAALRGMCGSLLGWVPNVG